MGKLVYIYSIFAIQIEKMKIQKNIQVNLVKKNQINLQWVYLHHLFLSFYVVVLFWQVAISFRFQILF